MIKKNKLILIGPYPPPFGGVSIHIQRLEYFLKNDFFVKIIDESREKKNTVFNIRSLNVFRYIGMIFKADIIHIHSGVGLFRFCHFIVGKILRKYIVITIHSYKGKSKGMFKKWIDKKILLSAGKVIFVSDEIADQFKIKGAAIQNAFLPPFDNNGSLPNEVELWVTKKKEQGFIICSANAWRLIVHNNQDLYGLDLCIEAVKYFRINHLKICIIFVVSDMEDPGYANVFKRSIIDNDLEEHIYLYTSSLNFTRLIEKCDMILRPTNTDGDSLTIREALYFGKPVIASNVVKRPEGTIYFKNRDVDSFILNMLEVSKNLSSKSKCSQDLTLEKYKSFYSNIYLKNKS